MPQNIALVLGYDKVLSVKSHSMLKKLRRTVAPVT